MSRCCFHENSILPPQKLICAASSEESPQDTINTIPEKTLLAFADHGQVKDVLPRDGGDAEEVLREFQHAGVNLAALATQLQHEGAEAFDKSWNDLLECIATKVTGLKKAG